MGNVAGMKTTAVLRATGFASAMELMPTAAAGEEHLKLLLL
jgi:hypothetical protein